MTTLTAATVPHPILDRVRGFICGLTPTRKPVTDPTDLVAPGEYLCPAPTSRLFACHRPLPCSSHGIDHPWQGWLVHGSAFLRLPEKPRRRWFHRSPR